MTWEQLAPRISAADAAAELPMDSESFAAFYERSSRPLWAYLARVSGDPALADDLMQESFVRFLCADFKAEDEASGRRYLFRIGTNLMKDHWRRKPSSSIEEMPELAFASHTGESQMDSNALLAAAMNQMKPKERQMLWLAYAEGYSHKEIAEVMGVGSASVRLLLFRARRKIAGYLAVEEGA
jgi:RNA polymerase sigma-70 factor (ECF subfamily)